MKKEKAFEFTVDRKNWFRGSRYDSSLLISPSHALDCGVPEEHIGKMCCLGFYAKACGVSEKALKNTNASSPQELSEAKARLPKQFKKLLVDHKWHDLDVNESKLSLKLMSTNDSHKISNKTREARLKKLFKEINVTVKFKG